METSPTDDIAPTGEKNTAEISKKSIKEYNVPVLEVNLYGKNSRGSRVTGTTEADGDNNHIFEFKKKDKKDDGSDEDLLRVKRKERGAAHFKTKTIVNDENDVIVNKGSPANFKGKASKPPVISTNSIKSPQKAHHPLGMSRAQNSKNRTLTNSLLTKQSALNNYYKYKRGSRLGAHHTLLTGRSSLLSGYRGGVNSVMNESPFQAKDEKLFGCQ